MNTYSVAYSIGYFYGRAYPIDQDVPLPAQDLYHKQNQGFTDGLKAGRRDFQDIDLPMIAESHNVVDPL